MTIERYKLEYLNGTLIRVIEITDENGVIREVPVVWDSGSPGWSSFLSGIVGCSSSISGSVANLEIIQNCLFDNTTGDFLNMVPFVRYVTIDVITGDLTYLGDYQFVSTGVIPYTLIGTPVQQAGADVVATEAHRDVMATSGSQWSLSSHPQTIMVQFNVISGNPQLSDVDANVTNMYAGESVVFSATDDGAGLLTGNLSMTAGDGDIVTASWVELST